MMLSGYEMSSSGGSSKPLEYLLLYFFEGERESQRKKMPVNSRTESISLSCVFFILKKRKTNSEIESLKSLKMVPPFETIAEGKKQVLLTSRFRFE